MLICWPGQGGDFLPRYVSGERVKCQKIKPGTGHGRTMDQNLTMREWLDWLTRVRLLLIALILAVGVVWPQYVPGPRHEPLFPAADRLLDHAWHDSHHSVALASRMPGGMAPLQVTSDVVMVSALVYATGLQDSYFISLYLLVIIVASILFSRGVAFATAAVCVAILGGLTALASRGKDSRARSAACTRRKACVSGF